MPGYLWRGSAAQGSTELLPARRVIHLPRHTPAARLLPGLYQRLCAAITFRKRGGVCGRLAGPRSFPTLIRSARALDAAVKDLGCPEPRLPLPAPPARRLLARVEAEVRAAARLGGGGEVGGVAVGAGPPAGEGAPGPRSLEGQGEILPSQTLVPC